jgi:hypothetical protein
LYELADFCQECQDSKMPLEPTPGALLWPAAILTWRPGYASSLHRHHSVQLTLALHGTLRIRQSTTDEWRSVAAALIRPGAAHEVDATGVSTFIAFVDPQSELGATLLERTTGDITTLDGAELTRWRAALGKPTGLDEKVVDHWVREEFQCGRGPATIHVSIQPILGASGFSVGAPGPD